MEKNNTKSYYKIGEVSETLDLPVPTLRYWEREFEQLDPFRTPGGTRKYRPEDVEMCKLIKHLLRDKGYSLEYAKKELADYRKYPPRHHFVCKSVDDVLRLLSEAKSRCEDAHAIARIEAVTQWLTQRKASALGTFKEKDAEPHGEFCARLHKG